MFYAWRCSIKCYTVLKTVSFQSFIQKQTDKIEHPRWSSRGEKVLECLSTFLLFLSSDPNDNLYGTDTFHVSDVLPRLLSKFSVPSDCASFTYKWHTNHALGGWKCSPDMLCDLVVRGIIFISMQFISFVLMTLLLYFEHRLLEHLLVGLYSPKQSFWNFCLYI